jgi:hypothetical protein
MLRVKLRFFQNKTQCSTQGSNNKNNKPNYFHSAVKIKLQANYSNNCNFQHTMKRTLLIMTMKKHLFSSQLSDDDLCPEVDLKETCNTKVWLLFK